MANGAGSSVALDDWRVRTSRSMDGWLQPQQQQPLQPQVAAGVFGKVAPVGRRAGAPRMLAERMATAAD